MRRGPIALSHLIIDTMDLDEKPSPIRNVIADYIINYNWESNKDVATEKAEKWEREVITYLQKELNKLAIMGRPPRIAFNSSSDYIIQGACFVEPKDSDSLKESKLRRLKSTSYYDFFRDINPTQFEMLCGKLIHLIGVKKPYITRSTSDDGIDFYGLLSLESIFFPKDLTPTIQKNLNIWLVGQAKRFNFTQVSTKEIRELAGSVMLGRSYAFGSSESPTPNMTIRVCDPIFCILITTGYFSANAWRLLERSGVIGMDGEMVAAFLADRCAGSTMGNDINKDSFFKWLENG